MGADDAADEARPLVGRSADARPDNRAGGYLNTAPGRKS